MNSTEKWKYAKVPIEQLEAASMNANKMTEQELDRLTKNIKISGLSSVITCYKMITRFIKVNSGICCFYINI